MAPVLVISTRGTRIALHRRTLSQSIRVGVVTLSVILILLIATVLVAYLMASNVSATKGYEIKELKQQREELLRTGEHLTMVIAENASLESMATLANHGTIAKMAQPDEKNVAYVQSASSQVAKK